MPQEIAVEIFTKKDCCLCDTAKETLDRVLPDYPVRLRVTDIESDPRLWERYRERIPVVLIEGRESFVYKVHETTLRKKLDRILAGQ
ncbi:MAG: glutaredoxin family protein [Nitrospinales bacterium]